MFRFEIAPRFFTVCFALKISNIRMAAPKARNMTARGKREARRPWKQIKIYVQP